MTVFTQGVVQRPATSALPGNSLRIQNHKHHPRPTTSPSRGGEHRDQFQQDLGGF